MMEKENKLTSKPLSDVEAIRGYLESDIPVYLHGLSGCGKSARVKEIDPNAEIIYLRNATPESINGKSVYVPPLTKKVEVKNGDEVELQDVILRRGYMMDIKPSWLQRITKRALEEPDKIHVLFFDYYDLCQRIRIQFLLVVLQISDYIIGRHSHDIILINS